MKEKQISCSWGNLRTWFVFVFMPYIYMIYDIHKAWDSENFDTM